MPGFIKTPKDEARWKRAKDAASKETAEGSESYWKLSNYIYHKMGKTEEDHKMADLYKNEITNDFRSGKELSIENIRHFLMNDGLKRQSILSNEVEQMSDEKKYTAKEAAIAVLKKAEEVLKKSEVLKKAQVAKSEEPKGEIHPKEPQAGESEKPGNRIQEQAAPDKNPKEQAEGNNMPAGTTPTQVGQDGKNKPGFDEMRGHIKLAKFIGHMQAKRKKLMPGAV